MYRTYSGITDLSIGSSNANEVVQISLVKPGAESPEALSTFHPQFTYSIFGDEERIFGYQGLSVKLQFAAHDLYPNVGTRYDSKFKPVGDTQATDVLEILRKLLPPCKHIALFRFRLAV